MKDFPPLCREATQATCPGHGQNACCDCGKLAGCQNSTYVESAHHRFLKAIDHGDDQDHDGSVHWDSCPISEMPWHGCCHNGMKTGRNAYIIELVLHWLSVGILSFFMLQMILFMILYGRSFWKNVFYVVDFVVIFASLALEVTVFETRKYLGTVGDVASIITGLLILVLVWRFVRVGHGIFVTAEKSHHLQLEGTHSVLKKFHNRIHNTKMLLTAVRHGTHHFRDDTEDKSLAKHDKKLLKRCKDSPADITESIDELEGLLRRRIEYRHKYEAYLQEISGSLDNVYKQMTAHEEMLKEELEHLEHHSNSTGLQGHSHKGGKHGHGKKKHNRNHKKVAPNDVKTTSAH